jgi:methionine synthase II (cobalamin-independent)
MKFKALRTKREPKEFIYIDVIEKTMIIYTSELPKPQPLTATVELTKDYYKDCVPLPDQMSFDEMEMVEFEIFETNVGADIRNKLTSPLSLTAMLKHYFKEKDSEVKAQLEQLIKNEIKQSEKDIKYIAKLL